LAKKAKFFKKTKKNQKSQICQKAKIIQILAFLEIFVFLGTSLLFVISEATQGPHRSRVHDTK
jgi:hypothetical protein